MSTIHVPHLQTAFLIVPNANMLIFPEDRHRTFFAIQSREISDIHIWIGLNPDPDIDNWFTISGTENVDIFPMTRGVYGPIHIAETGALDGEITILSSIVETPTIVLLP